MLQALKITLFGKNMFVFTFYLKVSSFFHNYWECMYVVAKWVLPTDSKNIKLNSIIFKWIVSHYRWSETNWHAL